jgi:L-ascorbate metabolism protein UlaG (beta-lactamase superfamily)
MKIRWYGQSAFLLTGQKRVFIDPFGSAFRLPPIENADADVLLVTHEHRDHNAVEVVGGNPVVVRAPGRHDSPAGEIVGIASEHDAVAGTKRGPNTMYRLTLDGLAVAHLGDFGQDALRSEQRAALGDVDVLFLPVGGGPTIGGEAAVALVHELQPRLVVPMHYRTTDALDFLEPPDEFLAALGAPITRLDGNEADAESLLASRAELAVALLAPPLP